MLVQVHLPIKWQSLDTNSDMFEATIHAHSPLSNISPFPDPPLAKYTEKYFVFIQIGILTQLPEAEGY